MAVVVEYESNHGKEVWKWEHLDTERHPSDPSIRGMRPSTPQAYPAMLYKATDNNPWKFENFTVKDELEQRNMESRGFVSGGKAAAMKAFEDERQSRAVAAAHRNYEDRNVSEAARKEIDAAEQASSTHLGEIPATPIRRRGRPKKQTPAEVAPA